MVGPSAVANQLVVPLKKLTRAPLIVVSKKKFDVMAHPEAECPSQQNILIFIFSYFTIF